MGIARNRFSSTLRLRAPDHEQEVRMSASEDKFYHAEVTERVDLAPTLWTFRIRPDGDFTFLPGQYATLGIESSDKKRRERPYSIVSAPFEKEIEFFFELVPEGDLTPLLHRLQRGDQLLMRKVAKGRFTLDVQSGPTNHFLLCTVTGVAPFVSYLRTLWQQSKEGKFSGEHKLFLLNGASRSWEFGYHDELLGYARQVPWFRYQPTVSRPWEDPAWRGETGRVDDIVRKYADRWDLGSENSIAYLCGHPEMIQHCKGILTRVGFRKEFVREEFYWVPHKS
jgi:ferredoxin/flavodoxin---NADP+ reductase